MAEFVCSECGYQKVLNDAMIGKKAKCPKCKATNVVSHEADPPVASFAESFPEPPPAAESSPHPSGVAIKTPSVRSVYLNRKPDNFFLGLLDFKLEKYITPLICRITWAWAVAMIAMYLFTVIATEFGFADALLFGSMRVSPLDASDDHILKVRWLIGLFVKISAGGMALLWIRVALESAVVYFNMAKSLGEIEQNTK